MASARPFGGCAWSLLFGALGFLGLLPALGCLFLFCFFVFVFVVVVVVVVVVVFVFGVSFLGLWGFCSPWGVRLLSWRGFVGVCLLALWGFCSALLRFSSSLWLPLAWVLQLLVAGAWLSEASAGVSLFLLLVEVGVCFFGALELLPTLGCASSS